MWEIVKTCIIFAAIVVLFYFALKGTKSLTKESDARADSRSNSDAYIKRGYNPDEQEKRRIEENR